MNSKLKKLIVFGTAFIAGTVTFKLLRRRDEKRKLEEVEEFIDRRYIDLVAEQEKLKEYQEELEEKQAELEEEQEKVKELSA